MPLLRRVVCPDRGHPRPHVRRRRHVGGKLRIRVLRLRKQVTPTALPGPRPRPATGQWLTCSGRRVSMRGMTTKSPGGGGVDRIEQIMTDALGGALSEVFRDLDGEKDVAYLSCAMVACDFVGAMAYLTDKHRGTRSITLMAVEFASRIRSAYDQAGKYESEVSSGVGAEDVGYGDEV